MARPLDHPNEPGRWTLVRARPGAAVWRRDRDDPFPVTLFYLLTPPAQPQVFYDEARTLALLDAAQVRSA